ncbi:MAG TPA: MBL fold metallo-hydrolase [Acidimicrobiia bacterium]|nr:MBL fold metallo-hydrolase [Acidimicrobiia bacterium]
MPTITFLGGTDTVTGSKFLLGAGGGSLLVECGLFQGPREVRQLNWEDPAFAGILPDEVLLTHAHIDHSGYLPRLVSHHGYAGPVRATAATVDLLGVMLPDSARLQEEAAEYANKKGYSRHRPAFPLYTERDAERALRLLRPAPYHEWFPVPGGRARLTRAGHILGSAHAVVEVEGRRLVFSGDVGRWDIPVLEDPEPPTGAHLLLLESTYGGRSHPADADPDAVLAGMVNRVAERGGVMVVPAFSVGRSQDILFRLRQLEEDGRIPRLPVFLDSPMSIEATGLYRKHAEEHDAEMRSLQEAGVSPFRPARLHLTRTVEESKAINHVEPPAIVLSASGMASGGRVVHHLKRRLPFPQNLVAFVGYQAEGTLGRSLVDGATRVHIHGDEVQVRAEVVMLDVFSAHADQEELVRWVREAAPERIALVHGEEEGRRALAAALAGTFGGEVLLPQRGDVLEV